MTDADTLAATSARVEQLLAEVRELVPLPAWQRVDEALRGIVALYGAGLARVLAHAHAAGAGPGFGGRLADDELVASLLVVHGLHPSPTGERVERALAAVRAELGVGDDALAIAGLDGGALRLHAGALGGGAMAPGLAESIVRRAVETAAPEITSIEIAGLPVPRDPTLVQIRTSRTSP